MPGEVVGLLRHLGDRLGVDEQQLGVRAAARAVCIAIRLRERRADVEPRHQPGARHVGDVENDDARRAVAAGRRGRRRRTAARAARSAGPGSHLPRRTAPAGTIGPTSTGCRVLDVEDDVDVPVETRLARRHVHVAATVVVVAVDAAERRSASGRAARGERGSRDVPEPDALVAGVVDVAAPRLRSVLDALHQEAVGDLHLPGGAALGPLDRGDELHGGRVGDVDDAEPRLPEVGDEEVPPVAHGLQRQLEAGPSVEIVVADQVDAVGGVGRSLRPGS